MFFYGILEGYHLVCGRLYLRQSLGTAERVQRRFDEGSSPVIHHKPHRVHTLRSTPSMERDTVGSAEELHEGKQSRWLEFTQVDAKRKYVCTKCLNSQSFKSSSC
jgi:hypothetical protein